MKGDFVSLSESEFAEFKNDQNLKITFILLPFSYLFVRLAIKGDYFCRNSNL